MTNLTDKWRKSELTNGWYWVEGSRSEGIYAYTAEYLNNMYKPRNGERIIEQVPSYEQWQAKLEENTKLKELLKRIGKQLRDCPSCVEGSWKAELVDKIDQVLGE